MPGRRARYAYTQDDHPTPAEAVPHLGDTTRDAEAVLHLGDTPRTAEAPAT